MVNQEMQTADALARVTLPAEFAEKTVVVERLSQSEVRIRKLGEEGDELSMLPENNITTLSNGERDRFVELIVSPQTANPALCKAISKRTRDG